MFAIKNFIYKKAMEYLPLAYNGIKTGLSSGLNWAGKKIVTSAAYKVVFKKPKDYGTTLIDRVGTNAKDIVADPTKKANDRAKEIIKQAERLNDVLEEYHNFANDEFTDFLEQHGFHVAKQSFANYPLSMQSIPSLMT